MELSNYQAFMECMRKWEKIGCNILCGLALWEQMQDCDRRGVPYTDIDIEAVSQDVVYRLMMSHDRLYALALYFLNPVDEADLMALLEDDNQNTPVVCSCTEKCTAGKVNTNCALCKTDMTNCAGKEAMPEETEQPDEPTPEKKNNVGGILILVLFLAAGGGGALWYFKLRKPKSSVKGGDELDEFDFDEDDEAEEYGDDEDADSASDPDEQENEE